MSGAVGLLGDLRLAELLGVERHAEGGLDARAEGLGVAEVQDAGGVELGLDEGGAVEVGLDANLKGDVGSGGLGVVDGLCGKERLRDEFTDIRTNAGQKNPGSPWHQPQHQS